MKKATFYLIVVGLIGSCSLWAETKESTSPLKAEVKLGTDVEDRQPVGVAGSFSLDKADHVVAWTRVKGAREPTEVKHVWLFEGEEMASITLPVKSSSFRTWSRKRLRGKSGQWRVEIRDADNRLITAVPFTVTPTERAN